MDELRETSGGIYTKQNVPPEHHKAILEVTQSWPEEDQHPEMFLP